MKQDHAGMIVFAVLVAGLIILTLSSCEFSVGIGVDIDSHPPDELPTDYKSTIPENCHATTNTTINEWKLKHCDQLSWGPTDLNVVGIGLD